MPATRAATLRASQLYLVRDHRPPLVLGTVGWVRARPHLLLVLVSTCRLCEEDVGMYDSETKTLHVAKLNLTVHVQLAPAVSDAPERLPVLTWRGTRIPSTRGISTQPLPLATLPEHGAADCITPAHAQYAMAYHHHCRALAQYTECTRFESGVRACLLHECLSWLSAPPPLQPPRRQPPNGHVN